MRGHIAIRLALNGWPDRPSAAGPPELFLYLRIRQRMTRFTSTLADSLVSRPVRDTLAFYTLHAALELAHTIGAWLIFAAHALCNTSSFRDDHFKLAEEFFSSRCY